MGSTVSKEKCARLCYNNLSCFGWTDCPGNGCYLKGSAWSSTAETAASGCSYGDRLQGRPDRFHADTLRAAITVWSATEADARTNPNLLALKSFHEYKLKINRVVRTSGLPDFVTTYDYIKIKVISLCVPDIKCEKSTVYNLGYKKINGFL